MKKEDKIAALKGFDGLLEGLRKKQLFAKMKKPNDGGQVESFVADAVSNVVGDEEEKEKSKLSSAKDLLKKRLGY